MHYLTIEDALYALPIPIRPPPEVTCSLGGQFLEKQKAYFMPWNFVCKGFL